MAAAVYAQVTPDTLVRAAVGGDREAFAQLVEPLLAPCLAAAGIITGSRQDGADAVQDALLAAWLGLPSLRRAEAFPSWFRTHVLRASGRIARRRRTVVELGIELPAPSGELESALERRQLARAWSRLDQGDRTVLTLHFLWRLPASESAVLLACPEGTVRSRVHHAVRRLRAQYESEERR